MNTSIVDDFRQRHGLVACQEAAASLCLVMENELMVLILQNTQSFDVVHILIFSYMI